MWLLWKLFKGSAGGSGLPPAFSGASPGCTRGSRTASGQDSAPVHTLSRGGKLNKRYTQNRKLEGRGN